MKSGRVELVLLLQFCLFKKKIVIRQKNTKKIKIKN